MAEQDKPKAASQATPSSISDTISELLQNPAQVDIATTLGLLDDPSALTGSGLDTSAILDPSSFLAPPSTIVSGQTLSTTEATKPSSTRTFTSPASLEAISSRLLQGISSSMSSEMAASVISAQKPSQLASKGSKVDAPPKIDAPPTSDTVTDLTSLINSIVSQEQQTGGNIVATAMTSSALLQPQQNQSMSSILGSNPSPIPIPSVTHIPHTSSTPAQGLIGQNPQRSLTSNQKDSIVQESTVTPSLGELCKSLPIGGVSVETPSHGAPIPATTLSASLPPAANVDKSKTAVELSTAVMDQSKVPTQGSNAGTAVVSSGLKAVADTGLQQQAPVSSTVQHENKPFNEALSVTSTASASSLSGVFEAKKPGVDSVGKSTAIPSSFLSAIQLQHSPQKSVAQVVQVGSQLQTSAAQPQVLKSSLSSIPSAVTALLPTGLTDSAAVQAKPAVTATTTKSSSATAFQQTSTPPVANIATPPTDTPTTIQAKTQTAGSSGQMGTTSTNTSTSLTTPKDLNLPLLQFLQANFPALQLGGLTGGGGGDGSKEVLQVHTLLAHVIQQQQQLQQLQQQAQQQVQKAMASGKPMGGGI